MVPFWMGNIVFNDINSCRFDRKFPILYHISTVNNNRQFYFVDVKTKFYKEILPHSLIVCCIIYIIDLNNWNRIKISFIKWIIQKNLWHLNWAKISMKHIQSMQNLWKNLLDKFIFIFVNRVCIMMHIIRIVKSDKL